MDKITPPISKEIVIKTKDNLRDINPQLNVRDIFLGYMSDVHGASPLPYACPTHIFTRCYSTTNMYLPAGVV
jgi:hypothetical protein